MPKAGGLWLGIALLLTVTLATEPGAASGPDPAPSDSAAGPASTEQAPSAESQAPGGKTDLFDYVLSSEYRPIRSILVDQEAPLTGIKWGGDASFDAPLNNEPPDASPTLRSAMLKFYRSFGEAWFLKLTLSYNNAGKFELSDNYLGYSGWKSASATMGVYTPPFSLEFVSSFNALTFMERSLPVVALGERRSGGLGVLKRTPKSILSAGLFFYQPEEEGRAEAGQALILNYVHSPIDLIFGSDTHFGGSLSYRLNAEEQKTRFQSRPEFGITDDYFVDTGPIAGAENVFRLGLQASKVSGTFSWQAELLSARVERTGHENVWFEGGYIMASWFLTGESRNYQAGAGNFQPVAPNRPLGRDGYGAFEIALRVSTVDLNDRDIIGGKETNVSLGLNWYLRPQLRLMANLIKVLDLERPGSEFDGEEPLIFGLRAQVYIN